MSALLREDIYEKLRSEILACDLSPGEELRELDLAARFAVSRAPVRDALQRLGHERLVRVLPRQGYRVTQVDVADARDLFDMRIALEPICAANAATRADETALRAFDRFRAPASGRSFVEENRDFHVALADASGNRRMAAAVRDLVEQADRIVRISVAALHDRDTSRLVAEHAAMIDALQARDDAHVAAIMRAHIADARARVLGAIERITTPPPTD